jgi:hypothetical protein
MWHLPPSHPSFSRFFLAVIPAGVTEEKALKHDFPCLRQPVNISHGPPPPIALPPSYLPPLRTSLPSFKKRGRKYSRSRWPENFFEKYLPIKKQENFEKHGSHLGLAGTWVLHTDHTTNRRNLRKHHNTNSTVTKQL